MDYKKHYDRLIQRAKNRLMEADAYYERHHICPRCMGGSDQPDNLVYLTPEEHLIAHLLLVKLYPNNHKLIYAANMMTNRVNNNKEYGWLKRKTSMAFSSDFYGRKRSPESILKQKQTLLERYKTGEIVSARKGSTLTDDHKNKIRDANKGRTIPEESRSSLAGFIMRYGDDEGMKKYKEANEKKKTSSLEHFIKKYGEEQGKIKFEEMRYTRSNNMSGDKNSFYGKNHTEETRKKISLLKKGKSVHRTEEHNKKIGEALKGKKQPTSICPHCGKQGSTANIKRWHLDNCRLKQS